MMHYYELNYTTLYKLLTLMLSKYKYTLLYLNLHFEVTLTRLLTVFLMCDINSFTYEKHF